ncbi:hypothetical protein A5647_05800 [Mycobacterium sp. 1100029.7]|nr:hypothetical protein A5647_05800 [Mycobacterium sp. 1100029.7]
MTRDIGMTAANQQFQSTFSDADYVEALDSYGRRLIEAAHERTSDAEIPFCSGWTLGELVNHLDAVYRWTAVVVGEACTQRPRLADFENDDVTDFAGALRRLSGAHSLLVERLHLASDDLACWTIWNVTSSRTFWARRMLHETVIHGVDVENAGVSTAPIGGAGLPTPIAADGVDEMVCGFAGRYAKTLRTQHPAVLELSTTDTDQRWWVNISTETPQFGRGASPVPADTRLLAHSGEVLLLLWNRRSTDGLAVDGRHDVLDIWAREAHL